VEAPGIEYQRGLLCTVSRSQQKRRKPWFIVTSCTRTIGPKRTRTAGDRHALAHSMPTGANWRRQGFPRIPAAVHPREHWRAADVGPPGEGASSLVSSQGGSAGSRYLNWAWSFSLAPLEHREARLLDAVRSVEVRHDIPSAEDPLAEPNVHADDAHRISETPARLSGYFPTACDDQVVARPPCVSGDPASRTVLPSATCVKLGGEHDDSFGAGVTTFIALFVFVKPTGIASGV
jgi:hypothetical protein